MKELHTGSDLSAYLDGELAPAERSRVDDHLAACGPCRVRLAELRAIASLVAALPSAQPARSLVPRVAARWNWLRPARSLSAFASGAFLFVFLLTAVGQSGSGLGGGPTSPFSPMAPAAPAAEAQRTEDKTTAAAPAPQFAQPTVTDAGGAGVRPLTSDEVARDQSLRTATPSPLTYPPLWLALAVAAGLAAIAAHWRLRAT